jgi:hypothetical protein
MRWHLRVIGWLSVALGVAALVTDLEVAAAAPYRPSDDAQVLERLPSAGSKTARELRELHGELAGSPQNLGLALNVARRDIFRRAWSIVVSDGSMPIFHRSRR